MSDQPPKSVVRRTPPPQEPDDKTQLKTIMEQIKLASGVATAPSAAVETPTAAPPVQIPIAIPPPAQEEPKAAVVPVTAAALAAAPPTERFLTIAAGDVVQVVNRENQNFGILFIVGDVQGDSVHGFWLMPGAAKEFITVEISDLINEKGLALIGQTRVRSHSPTSPQWQKQYGQTN